MLGFHCPTVFPFDVPLWTVRASLIAQLIKTLPAMQETPIHSRTEKIRRRRDRLLSAVFLGFPCGSAGKKSTCNAGDLSSIPGLGKSPGEGKVYPLQYSGLENSMNCIVPAVTRSRTRLSNFHFPFLDCKIGRAWTVSWAGLMCVFIWFPSQNRAA